MKLFKQLVESLFMIFIMKKLIKLPKDFLFFLLWNAFMLVLSKNLLLSQKKTLRRVPFEQSRQSTTPPAKYSHVDAADALRAIRSLPRERLAGVLEPVTFWRIILRKKLDLNSDVLPPHAVSPITKHQHQQ
mmetsp:Transcript_7568/g.9596  ORF Transcript_7568/g.9596 Transcript_7568/m.9596 type:complete len:131 (-) Transcript_7568:261-653(-)